MCSVFRGANVSNLENALTEKAARCRTPPHLNAVLHTDISPKRKGLGEIAVQFWA